jgi:hypothetical protein
MTSKMTEKAVLPPLSNLQMELLQLYASGVPDEYLTEIKEMIARFLLSKAREEAARVWAEKGYDDETAQQLVKGDLP